MTRLRNKQLIRLAVALIALFIVTTSIIAWISYTLIREDAREHALRSADIRIDRVFRKMAERGPPKASEAHIYFALLDGRPARPDGDNASVQRYVLEPAVEPDRIYMLFPSDAAEPLTWPRTAVIAPEFLPRNRVRAQRVTLRLPGRGQASLEANYLGALRSWSDVSGKTKARLVVLSRVEPIGPLHQRVAAIWVGMMATLSFAAALIVLYLQGRFDARLHEFNRLCHEITRTGDLKGRVPVTGADELGTLAHNINRMLDEIQDRERLIALQDRFLDHDYRAPIAAIISAAEALMDSLPAGHDGLRAQVDGILRTARRMNQGAQERLELYRFDRDVLEGNTARQECFDLREVTEEAVDGNWVLAEERGVTVRLQQGTEANEVVGSPSLILRAIGNLVRNAIQHAPPGSVVDVGVDCADGIPSVTIRDYGPGMTRESLRASMTPGELPPSTRPGGVGLGIESARGIVKAHRAELRLENVTPGLRARIRFTPGLTFSI